jgi:F0F1-type ATP synthase assembly protein I
MEKSYQNNEKIEKKKMPRLLRISLGIVVGALLGYAYYHFIGCNGNTCPITSDPWNSTIGGMILGAIWTIK